MNGDRAAALTVCARATDHADARELLMMLGLIEAPAKRRRPRPAGRMLATRAGRMWPLADPPKPSPHLTGHDLAWMRANGYLQEAS